jgi:hypothetical protein
VRNRPLLLLLLAVVSTPAFSRAQSGTPPMEIGVRSGIDLVEFHHRKKDLAYAQDISKHANIYVLASVSPHPSVGALVKEVNAIAIAKEIDRQLQAHGFRPVAPDEVPQIVITVEYGRGWLSNPYLDDAAAPDLNNLTDSDRLSPPWHLKEIFFSLGDEMKRQRADQEMLIIQVKAWRYEPNPKIRPTMVWMTSMHVDDPDHRDLNEIYQKMLAAGAPHFDQPIDREHELMVKEPVPEGHVKVGTPEVVGDPSGPRPLTK